MDELFARYSRRYQAIFHAVPSITSAPEFREFDELAHARLLILESCKGLQIMPLFQP